MPRNKLIYTHEFPYHIAARSNNKEWFYLEQKIVWQVMASAAQKVSDKYSALIHAFVLMNNHYHMIISTSPEFPLGVVTCEFQKSVSREINRIAKRTNHVFGGPCKPSLIATPEYYYRVIRYVYQNPLRAGVCKYVEDYQYSTLVSDQFSTCSPATGIAHLLPAKDFLSWINEPASRAMCEGTRVGLRKTVFKPVNARNY